MLVIIYQRFYQQFKYYRNVVAVYNSHQKRVVPFMFLILMGEYKRFRGKKERK